MDKSRRPEGVWLWGNVTVRLSGRVAQHGERPMAMAATAGGVPRPMTREDRKVILASSVGTIFEWYDFYLAGALVFGSLGDLIGRKYTFLVTMTLMGISTFVVGLIPSYASIGIVAPVLFI